MNLKNDSPHGRCAKCGMTKMTVEDEKGSRKECPNCGSEGPKTGRTIVVTEGSTAATGPAKVTFVDAISGVPSAAATPASAAVSVPVASQPGVILIGVPVELFPEMVVWARKLRLPKNWTEAAKIKAITDFQVALNQKLGELTK